MFGKGMYLSVFYCVCYAKDRSTYMSEDHVEEGRYPDLNKEEDTRLDEIREEHMRYVAEDGEDKSKIHSLRWDV